MMGLAKLGSKVSGRLAAGFLLVLGMLVVLSAMSISTINSVASALSTINDENAVKQRYAINFRGSVHDRSIALRDVVLVSDEADLAEVLDEIDRLSRDYEESAGPMDEIFANRTVTDTEREILASIKEIEAQTLPLIEQVIELEAAGEIAAATRVLMEQARPAFVVWLARINEFIDYQEERNQGIGAEVRSTVDGFAAQTRVLTGLAVLAGAVIAGLIGRSITSPLRRVAGRAEAISAGRLDGDPLDLRTRSEIGDLGRAFDTMQATLAGRAEIIDRLSTGDDRVEIEQLSEHDRVGIALKRLVQSQEEISQALDAVARGELDVDVELRSSEDRLGQAVRRLLESTATLARLLDAISQGDTSVTVDFRSPDDALAGAAQRLLDATVEKQRADLETDRLRAEAEASAAQMESIVREVSASASQVSDSSRQVDTSAQAVAASMTEMSESIKAIAASAELAASQATGAAEVGEETSRIIDQLNESSVNIGQVIDVISEIAEQTNLLALNAAIEAARAGEAGRGFAVVASEVKQLAEQTAVSTGDIANRVSEVQDGCRRAVEANSRIVGTIGDLKEVADRIAVAVDAQTATSAQVTSRVEEVAGAAGEISQTASSMAELASGAAAN